MISRAAFVFVCLAAGGCTVDPIDLIPASEIALIERGPAATGGADAISVDDMLATARGDEPVDEEDASVEANQPMSVEEMLARVRDIDESQQTDDAEP